MQGYDARARHLAGPERIPAVLNRFLMIAIFCLCRLTLPLTDQLSKITINLVGEFQMWRGESKSEETDWNAEVLKVTSRVKFLSGAKAHDRNEADQM